MAPSSSLVVAGRAVVACLFRVGSRKVNSEAYWVLFRFLYWGQFVDPCLIIAGNYLVGSSVSECLV